MRIMKKKARRRRFDSRFYELDMRLCNLNKALEHHQFLWLNMRLLDINHLKKTPSLVSLLTSISYSRQPFRIPLDWTLLYLSLDSDKTYYLGFSLVKKQDTDHKICVPESYLKIHKKTTRKKTRIKPYLYVSYSLLKH